MATRDIYQVSHELDATTAQSIIDRLEFRGTDPTFTRMRDAYLDKLAFPHAAYILDIGCGTGVLARALVKREGFVGRVTGVDQSLALLNAARRLATEEGVAHLVEFHTGDGHALDFADAHFDTVIAHTVVSHVRDPLAVVKEMARVVRSGGMVAIFDGDYASWTHGFSDPELGKAMEDGIVAAVVSNPRVMRDMPRLLREAGLELVETMAHVYAEVGTGGFFLGTAEAYGPLVGRAGLVSQEQVDTWLAEQRRSAEDGTFFGASNYYAYVARRPNA
jgi:ubiquinone/menaquinone biosynthesis C-methylase UbiE